MLRLSPYVGNQLKEILPNPMSMMQEDEEKKDLIKPIDVLLHQLEDLHII